MSLLCLQRANDSLTYCEGSNVKGSHDWSKCTSCPPSTLTETSVSTVLTSEIPAKSVSRNSICLGTELNQDRGSLTAHCYIFSTGSEPWGAFYHVISIWEHGSGNFDAFCRVHEWHPRGHFIEFRSLERHHKEHCITFPTGRALDSMYLFTFCLLRRLEYTSYCVNPKDSSFTIKNRRDEQHSHLTIKNY